MKRKTKNDAVVVPAEPAAAPSGFVTRDEMEKFVLEEIDYDLDPFLKPIEEAFQKAITGLAADVDQDQSAIKLLLDRVDSLTVRLTAAEKQIEELNKRRTATAHRKTELEKG
jgi:hypothetical protein